MFYLFNVIDQKTKTKKKTKKKTISNVLRKVVLERHKSFLTQKNNS